MWYFIVFFQHFIGGINHCVDLIGLFPKPKALGIIVEENLGWFIFADNVCNYFSSTYMVYSIQRRSCSVHVPNILYFSHFILE